MFQSKLLQHPGEEVCEIHITLAQVLAHQVLVPVYGLNEFTAH